MSSETQFNPQEEMRKRLQAEIFPAENLCAKFHQFKNLVLQKHSRRSMECDFLTFLALHGKQDGDLYTLFEISFLFNAFESTRMEDFNLSTDQYLELMQDLEVMTVLWNELAKPHKEAVKRHTQALHERNIIPATNPQGHLNGNRQGRRK